MANSSNGRKAQLVIVEKGEGEIKKIELNRDLITLGRGKDNDITISNRSVSRHHARVVSKEGQFIFYDLGSANGTFLNGHKIDKRVLEDGDILYLGRKAVKLRYREVDGSSSDSEILRDREFDLLIQKGNYSTPVLSDISILNTTHLISYRQPTSQAAESFRVLRTNLILSKTSSSHNIFLVTSPGPGAGKSTVVTNLGIVIARAGNRVILIDSDLRKPFLDKVFGIAREPGLTNILTEGLDWKKTIRKTEIENLYLIPSGPTPPNPSELLGSRSMLELIKILRKNLDFVIFDSPPMMSVTDATVMATEVDGVIIVLDAGKVPINIAKYTEKSIKDIGGKVLGYIINKMSPDKDSGYYYYYYHHYYKKYYDDYSKGNEDKQAG